jgi:bla regulator protein blaR1
MSVEDGWTNFGANLLIVAVGLLLTATVGQSQTAAGWEQAAGGKMSFEVASIRPSAPTGYSQSNFSLDPGDGDPPTGGVLSADFPLSVYIMFAYKLWLTNDQINAMLAQQPKWASTDRFTIQARAVGHPTKDQMRLMMQSLLAERFKLAIHFEDQEVPVFVLTLAKAGKRGPKLIPHAEGPPCDSTGPTDVESTKTPKSVEAFPPTCGAPGSDVRASPSGPVSVVGVRDATLAIVGSSLGWAGRLGRPVVDRTGLDGKFDFVMEWTPESRKAPPDGIDTATDQQGTTFLEALREQLGLKLEAAKLKMTQPVIDHVERPSEN